MGFTYTKNDRQFHDAWAFILFMILTVGLNVVYSLHTTSISSQIKDINNEFRNQYTLLAIIGGNIGFTYAMALLSLFLCYVVPKVILIVSTILMPTLQIIFWVKRIKDSKDGMYVLIGIGIINLIFLILAISYVFMHFSYIATAMSTAAGIMLRHIISITLIFVIVSALLLASSGTAYFVDDNSSIIRTLRWVEIPMMIWKQTILFYFVQVFVSSIVAMNVSGTSFVAGKALKNTLYALGSISLGAMLVTIITMLQMLVNDSRERYRSRYDSRRSALGECIVEFIGAIASIFLSILGDIVRTANSIGFPYLSVHGTSYSESLAGSFNLLTTTGSEKLCSLFGLRFTVSLLVFAFFHISVAFNYFFYLDFIELGLYKSDEVLVVSASIAFLSALLFFPFVSLLRDATLALIYASVAAPERTMELYPDFHNVIQEAKMKHGYKDTIQTEMGEV